jgi:HD-GYP domain-containing protein (c-di-GMP phosphodiesterase class II)
MIYKKIESGDVKLGDPLPWPVYDNHGKLLLSEGKVIKTEKLLQGIISIGFYPSEDEDEDDDRLILRTPFAMIQDIYGKLKELLPRFKAGTATEETRNVLSHFTTQIIQLADKYPDALIAAVHLYCERPYSISHSLHTALLCAVFSKEIESSGVNRGAVIGAALTANIAMLKLQDNLEEQSAPPSEEQRQQIHNHPAEAVQLLKDAGITERLWLDAVRYHHENADGSGYPMGIGPELIPIEAKVIALADQYAATISQRKSRKAIEPPSCLRNLFVDKGKHFEEELCLRFIKMMGIYPPGTFVLLRNGDNAVVVKRPDADSKAMNPLVCSYKNAYEHVYPLPAFFDSGEAMYKIEKLRSREKLPFQYDDVWSL